MTGLARYLNGLSKGEARGALLSCCASARWADGMIAGRPFADDAAVHALARRVWEGLAREDWLEAFAAHPRIGERERAVGARERREQAGMDSASEETRRELVEANRAYEAKFGHVFLICATGKGADEMLRAARARLGNDADAELRVAAEQQALITSLRLAKLVGS